MIYIWPWLEKKKKKKKSDGRKMPILVRAWLLLLLAVIAKAAFTRMFPFHVEWINDFKAETEVGIFSLPLPCPLLVVDGGDL